MHALAQSQNGVSNPHGKLAQASAIMAWLALAGAVFLPLLAAVTFLYPSRQENFITQLSPHLDRLLRDDVPIRDRLIALVFHLIPTGFHVAALLSLRAAFRNFANGMMFSTSSVIALRRVATFLFLAVLAGFVAQVGVSFALTLSRPPGQHLISIGASSRQVAELFWAGVMMIVAWAMCEARNIADENASIV